ncbi:small VCP/p97-interacting protein isoform X2 [Hyla sarda]|uniref:small VCP/p97-interacting protein isoform X2 n=1 Tax=Hyla sarda TaxID=327740 RepID=UPI0024C382DB|nr:small VCP/p97-interacting protein isoform X2 [Hyla sarda]
MTGGVPRRTPTRHPPYTVGAPPPQDLKRRQLAEAAEKRQMEKLRRRDVAGKSLNDALGLVEKTRKSERMRSEKTAPAASRGIKNPMSVEQKKKKSQEVDNMAGHSGGGGGGGLRWQVG